MIPCSLGTTRPLISTSWLPGACAIGEVGVAMIRWRRFQFLMFVRTTMTPMMKSTPPMTRSAGMKSRISRGRHRVFAWLARQCFPRQEPIHLLLRDHLGPILLRLVELRLPRLVTRDQVARILLDRVVDGRSRGAKEVVNVVALAREHARDAERLAEQRALCSD